MDGVGLHDRGSSAPLDRPKSERSVALRPAQDDPDHAAAVRAGRGVEEDVDPGR